MKAVYRQYTDGTFATLSAVPAAWQHLGLLGPVIRAEVGDTITVYFKNQASQPYSNSPSWLKVSSHPRWSAADRLGRYRW